MKTIIANTILAVILLLCINSSAQVVASKKSISDDMMKCSYIFEGKIISSKNYIIHKNGKREKYISYLVEVNKVVKGNINKGTVNILLPNDMLSSDGGISVPGEALYCCYDVSPVKDSTTVNSNSKSLEYYCAESMCNGELKKDNNDNLIGYFPSISDFYTYISANYGVNVSTK